MDKIIHFLQQLAANNNREWFTAHKSEHLECKAIFDEFAARFIDGIREFDDSIGPLTVADCTYRIYRDTRFSQDKTPYKTHMGVFVCPGGKKSDYAGYYFQVGAEDYGYPSGCMLATGNYYCEPNVLKILREDIETDDTFDNAVKAAKGFSLDRDGALKRTPKGYPIDHPKAEYLKLRNFCLIKSPGLKYVQQPDLLKRLLKDFKTTKPFLDFVNRAVAFANNEEL